MPSSLRERLEVLGGELDLGASICKQLGAPSAADVAVEPHYDDHAAGRSRAEEHVGEADDVVAVDAQYGWPGGHPSVATTTASRARPATSSA